MDSYLFETMGDALEGVNSVVNGFVGNTSAISQ